MNWLGIIVGFGFGFTRFFFAFNKKRTAETQELLVMGFAMGVGFALGSAL